ncbi:deoxyadenosine/deoxycytidine kinase [Paenibacillus phyllosphaerae]|uniref:Deoxyadenosine/deoxycytidine kinase n=1 Tax=Paenibacillus phyllosphaerae TaxID=274593 RepID=A0A7W5B463_9BACL|nr:deoxynucleoside kinase [Paenibacillus phyllosphaerae]MBB3113376.1 deoxyadenosine/deoxycytidine kinase [Paenibacillus phyllosphaerae]
MQFSNYLGKLQEGRWDMVVIDAVVGAGKSTLMDILVKERGLTPFDEPVVDNPLLDKFYYDRERYSFSLQIFFLNQRFRHIKEASRVENAALDRSIYGDLIFARMLHDNGEMTTEEFNLYIDLFENMIEHCKAPKLMVYLELSVDGAIQRIQKRGREYEQIVERGYWEKLNKYYTEYFAQYNSSPILKINVDGIDFENNEEDRNYVLSLIDAKLAELN